MKTVEVYDVAFSAYEIRVWLEFRRVLFRSSSLCVTGETRLQDAEYPVTRS